MRNTSELYKTLREETGSFYEVRVTCGENEYTDARLKETKLYPALFSGSGPKFGQAYSAECDLVVREQPTNWPRMAKFTIETRISSADEARKSEWLSMGTFYTDQRAKTEGGALSIIGFDGMLLLEQSWTDKIPAADMPASWPITSKVMAELLVQATGVPLDERTTLDDTVACWGLDTTSTARDRWADIAAAHGGNLIITPEGKLRIVPFVKSGVSSNSAVAGVALVGVAVVGTNGMSGLSDADFIPMGMRCTKLTTSPKLEAVSGVILETEAGTQAAAGDGTGYTVSGTCNFADSEGVAALCLSNLQGFEYQPFEAEKAVLDPAAEPGDLIGIPGGICQVMSLSWNLGRHPRADISAPYEAEVDHEFTMQSDSAKTLKKALQANADLERRAFTAIEQTETAIIQRVGEEYATKDGVNQVTEKTEAGMSLLKDEFSVELNRIEKMGDDRYEEQQTYLRYVDGTLILGKKGDASSLRQTNEGQGLYVNDEVQYFVNQNEMMTPRKFRIPLGGTLQLGDFIFQPRSSGNMSLLWVGDD